MVATYSTMQQLGAQAPSFSLPDVCAADSLVSLEQFIGQPLLVMFICNHCPFVLHVMPQLALLANNFTTKGFAVIAISSNDADTYPQDGPEHMADFAKQNGFGFAYCYDQSQQVARAYDAACTPDFFVYDQQHKLRYRGQMDSSRPGNHQAISGLDLATAMQAVLDGKTPEPDQQPSVGCSIKWRSA